MDGDLLAACRDLLRRGLPRAVPRELGGEHRFIPLAVDINGDMAATAFVRHMTRRDIARLPGPARATLVPGLEKAIFQQRNGNWVYLGGGAGAPLEGYPLADRLPAGSQRGHLRAVSYGQVRRKRNPQKPVGLPV